MKPLQSMKIQEHVSLKELTTLRIGGTARYFCSVAKVAELAEALAFAHEKKIGFVVLGGGSNTLIADGGIDKLVIKMDIKGILWHENQEDFLVIVGGGESWDGLVAEAVRRRLWGIENLSGIPGTVGAAPIQNIGAYGTEIKETIEWVEVFDAKTGKLQKFSNEEFQFGYRDSIFKHSEGKSLIVTRVALRLKKSGVPKLDYKDLKERFKMYDSRLRRSGFGGQVRFMNGEKRRAPYPLTLADVRKAVLEIRTTKFPDLKEFGTAGSFFKNPLISKEKFSELKKKFPDLPGFEVPSTNHSLKAKSYLPTDLSACNAQAEAPTQAGKLKAIKIPLAWILDNICNLRGVTNGNVGLFKNQPIVLVNLGGATAEEVRALANQVIARVKDETGITIEWEVQSIC